MRYTLAQPGEYD